MTKYPFEDKEMIDVKLVTSIKFVLFQMVNYQNKVFTYG